MIEVDVTVGHGPYTETVRLKSDDGTRHATWDPKVKVWALHRWEEEPLKGSFWVWLSDVKTRQAAVRFVEGKTYGTLNTAGWPSS